MNDRFTRLGGKLVAVGWAVVCALMVTVQVTGPPQGIAAVGAAGDLARVGVPTWQVSPSSWAVGADGGTVVVTVDAPPGWKSSSDQDWLAVTFADGGVALTASANAGPLRTATVTVTSGGEVAMVAVAQAGRQAGTETPGPEASATPSPTRSAPEAVVPDVPPQVAPPPDPNPGSDLRGSIEIERQPNAVVVSGFLYDAARPGQVVSFEIYDVVGGVQTLVDVSKATMRRGDGLNAYSYTINRVPESVCVTAFTDYARRSLGCKAVPPPPAPPPR